MADVEQDINNKIRENKVMVFSKTTCPFCAMAKKSLSGYDYSVLELDKTPNGGKYQDVLQKITGARTVPRVFVNGKCIGGGTEVKELEKKGKLKSLLTADTKGK